MTVRADARPATRRTAPPAVSRAGASRGRHVRRRIVAVAVVVAVLLFAAWGVSVSPMLDVDHVQVRGAGHVGSDAIEAAGGIGSGDAMAWIDTGDAADAIEAMPYVRSATVAREWPDTVRITVRERRPAAWVAGPGGAALVDGQGRVLEHVAVPPPGLPELRGAQVVPPPGGTVDARDAARVAGTLSGLAASGTASVERTDHGIVLHLVSGPEIRMGAARSIGAKLRAALAVLAASEGRPVAYVDVSVPTNPVAG